MEDEPRDLVLERVAAAGYEVSPTQLARWHRAGLLPRPEQRSLGRGRGTETIYPPGTSTQVVAICQIREAERRLDRVAFQLWWDGFPVDVSLVRSQVTAAAARFDQELNGVDRGSAGPRAPIDGLLRRALGPAGVRAVEDGLRDAAVATTPQPRVAVSERLGGGPPRLRDLPSFIVDVAAPAMTGLHAEALVAASSDDDLATARTRVRSMLDVMRSAASPLAWLFGDAGSVFRLIDKLVDRLTVADLPAFIAAMLVFSPVIPDELVAALDSAGPEPPLAQELRLVLAIRERVPGAAEVLTPMTVRALLRDKEAARRHRPAVEAFVAEHRDEIVAMMNELGYTPDPAMEHD